MYVTRPLSRYLADYTAAAEPPPDGPGSGFLVVVDETGETARTRFWGLCVDRRMRRLPFPQNRLLGLRPNTNPDLLESLAMAVDFASEVVGVATQIIAGIGSGRAPASRTPKLPEYAMLVPVVGQPLSSGRYYVVKAEGKHRGKVSACSKEEDRSSSWFGSWVNDVKPQAFHRSDVYQQVWVQPLLSDGFVAHAVATDGIPPDYLRKKGWTVNTTMSPKYDLTDAQGMDSALRRRMPDFQSLTVAERRSPAVLVGRWYVPFMFVKADGYRSLKDQFRRCTFYEMTMDQIWVQISSCDNPCGEPGNVKVSATVPRPLAQLDGTSMVQEGWPQAGGGAVWFRPAAPAATAAAVALDTVVWERMMWELERGGWVANGDQERIERVERRDCHRHKFACYVLLERFQLKRMDGSLALTCEFRHTDKIKTKWL